MLKEIHVVLASANDGSPNEIFVETEDENGRGIGSDHGLKSENKPDGRDIIIDMVEPIRTFLQDAKRDLFEHDSHGRNMLDNLIQRLENKASE